MNSIQEHAPVLGVKEACNALGVPRPTFYRWLAQRGQKTNETSHCDTKTASQINHCRKLSEKEETEVLNILASKRFADMSVPQVFHTLLDEGRYLCAMRTMYRILKRNKALRERRDQLRHPDYKKPELLATMPNQVWSWDITKLKTPQKWTYYYLYVILDIFSRKVVAWTVAHSESQATAKRLILDAVLEQGIPHNQLTIHADRGAVMKSKAVSQLIADLRVERTHSRPHVSNDNPYSESQFKTLKYHPTFPNTFTSLDEAKTFLDSFFDWYNKQHKHSGIAFLSPDEVHTGRADEIISKRTNALLDAYKNNPERFVRKPPTPTPLPTEVWINRPTPNMVTFHVA